MNKLIKHISLIIFLLFILGGKQLSAQYAEYEIKAAYIFNFAKFIEWPATDYQHEDTIVLGIYKHDPFGIILEKTMTGRKVNGKDWKIQRLNNVTDLKQCHIVYFSDIGKYELLQIFDYLKAVPTLTIGDDLIDFCESGGMINFTPQYSEHQFEINNQVATSHRIKISPKLLLLSKIISSTEDEF